MRKNNTLLVAILNSVILYVDIIFKIILSFFDRTLIYIDYFWLGALLVIFALSWLLYFKGSRRINSISYVISWFPVMMFLSYWITLGMVSFEEENWKYVMTYMVSEIILFLPTYALAALDLKNSY